MATSGAACPKVGEFAQDGVHVLKCNAAMVWEPGLTVEVADQYYAVLKAHLAREANMRDHWANCTEVRNAGVAPITRGERGYALKLDRDRDGLACEIE
jgi:hypothetical protein